MKEVGKIFEVHLTEHISRIIGTNVRTMRGWHVDRSFATKVALQKKDFVTLRLL